MSAKKTEASPSTVTATYTGPFDAVVVLRPTGRTIQVAIGDVIQLMPNEAASLDGRPDWAFADPNSTETQEG